VKPLESEQAFVAVNAFLDGLWERTKQPGELGLFLSMISYTRGDGSLDPAMWYDWLACVNHLQTGEPIPENTGRRAALTAEMMRPLDPEQAYLAMFAFIEEYWKRVGRPDELGDLLDRMRYTPGTGSADPSLWKEWLAVFDRVQEG